MKLIHLSDLHLGKRLIDHSLLEDQEYILKGILRIIDDEKPDAVLIAGDVYDRSQPPAEAMTLFDSFMTDIAQRKIALMLISGNHDSAERVAYARSLLRTSNVYISPTWDEMPGAEVGPVTLRDEYGEVDFRLMPYLSPEDVRRYFPEGKISSADDAVRHVISAMDIDPARRNVILTHQFVSGGVIGGSERPTVGTAEMIGTLEAVDASRYDAFDYVALGHLHRPQSVGRDAVRYSGTPLAYSASEVGIRKTVTVVELREKGDVQIREVPLTPLREVRKVRGNFDAIMRQGPKAGEEDDYYFITLTDETDVPHGAEQLRARFPNMLSMDYDNKRTQGSAIRNGTIAVEDKSPLDILDEIYKKFHDDTPMPDDARNFVDKMIRQIEGWNE